MQAVPDPHANWKELLLAGQVKYHHVEQFGHLLGIIHRRSSERSPELAPLFDDTQFFESLRLEPYYQYTARQVPEAAAFYSDLIEATRSTRVSLVHGDYSPKNVLVHQDRLVLIDHEVIHFGDPAFDLGFSMTHLLSKARYRMDDRELFCNAVNHYWNAYQLALGEPGWRAALEERAVQHTLACLLARVRGRSPLEYLDPTMASRQERDTLHLMTQLPRSVDELVARWSALCQA